jgi:hypothetical protein
VLIIGRKRTGKSTLANAIAEGFYRSNPGTRVLVINVNGSEAYKKHKEITSYEKLTRWKHGIFQFYDRDQKTMFDFLINHFDPRKKKFHGMTIFEDATKYIDANPSREMKSFLVDHRMWDMDIVFTFHSFAMVPPFFWRMITDIIVLKTQDVIDASRDRMYLGKIPNWVEVYQAWKNVMQDPNEFAWKKVSAKQG